MSRMLASALAMFAASLLVLASAVMLTFSPRTPPASAPAPAALDQIEPRASNSRPARIKSDMTGTIREMEGRAEAEAGIKVPAAAVQPESPPAPPVAERTAGKPADKPAEKPAARTLPPVAAPPPGASLTAVEPSPSAAAPPAPPLPRPAGPAASASPDLSRSGPGPISLLPRRRGASSADTATPQSPRQPAPSPSTLKLMPPPSFTAAVPAAASGAEAAPASGPVFIPLADDEANLTADQLNERELQRIRKWRESEAARGATTQ